MLGEVLPAGRAEEARCHALKSPWVYVDFYVCVQVTLEFISRPGAE